MKVTRHVRRLEGQGPPQLIERAIKRAAGGQYTNDGVRFIIQENRSMDDRRIAAELTDPESVAEYDDPILPGLVFILKKRTAKRRLDSKDLEVARGHTPTP